MSPLDLLSHLTATAGALTALLRQVVVTAPLLRRLVPARPKVAYENLTLRLVLDIQDRAGRRAVLTRQQRVRVLTADGLAIRDLIWGEGNPVAHYRSRGARRLGILPEGSRRVALLGLSNQPAAGQVTAIETRRLIADGLPGREEYCELLVERPTQRVTVEVRFPPSRPPTEALLVTSPVQERPRRVRIRYGADGRPVLTWRKNRPATNTIYSLRWSW